MAKLIPGIKLSPAKNAQVDEYMRDVLENAKECPGIQTFLPADLAEFRAAAEALHEMASRPLRWELTPEIKDADAALDKALSALRYMMKAAVENPDEEARKAAKTVLRMSEIDKISGSEQYDQESGKISEMLTTLLGEYAGKTQAAGIMPFVLQLKERNEKLCQLLQERDLAQGEAGPHNTTGLRKKAEEAYQKLVLDVNSVATCIALGIIHLENGAENPFDAFINYMIGHIDRFHREVLRAKPAKPGETEDVEEEVTEETEEAEDSTPGGDNNQTPGGSTEGGNTEGGTTGDGGVILPGPPGEDPDL